MAKPVVKATRSSREGHVHLMAKASAYHFGQSVSSSVSIDLDIEAARAFRLELETAIAKAEEKITSKVERDARRKKWRDREIASGRMKIMAW